LFHLQHPLIGFVFPVEFGDRRDLKTARLHASGGSLENVISSPPASWTPTATAKAVVGIALWLRFAHGLGLLHGAVKSGNIFLMQISEFNSRISVQSGWQLATWNRFRGKSGRRLRTFGVCVSSF
jgi:hypothetical protein